MNILLEDFEAEVGSKDIFKLTVGIESLHEINNDNRVRIMNFAISGNLIVKNMLFQYQNIHKYAWTSDGKTHSQTDHIMIDERWHLSVTDVLSFRGSDCDTDHYLAVAKFGQRLSLDEQCKIFIWRDLISRSYSMEVGTVSS
jgi:hypothetical protein